MLLSLKTKHVSKSRDIILLNNNYGNWLMKKNEDDINGTKLTGAESGERNRYQVRSIDFIAVSSQR